MSGEIDFEGRADRANRLAYRVQAAAVLFWWVGMKWKDVRCWIPG